MPQPSVGGNIAAMHVWTILIGGLAMWSAHAETLNIPVVIYERASVPAKLLAKAKSHYAAVLGRAGITVEWHTDASKNGGTVDRLPLIIYIVTKDEAKGLHRPSHGLGMAFTSPTGQTLGTAVILYDQLEFVAQKHEAMLPLMLGHVMAHETGHILLGSAHSVSGVMKTEWRTADYYEAEQGRGVFNPHEARKMREALLGKRPDIARSGLSYR